MQDRAEHKLRPPSVSPRDRPPTPGSVPCRFLLAHPDPLPPSLNNVLTGSPGDSNPHTLTPVLHTPPLPLRDCSSPAPQTTHARIPAYIPLLSGSTPLPPASTLPCSTVRLCLSASPAQPPCFLLRVASGQPSAPRFLVHT